MVVVIPGTAEAVGQHAEVLATNETDAGLQFTAVEAGAWESLTATTSIGSWAPSPPVGGALTLAASGPGAKIRRWTGAPKGKVRAPYFDGATDALAAGPPSSEPG